MSSDTPLEKRHIVARVGEWILFRDDKGNAYLGGPKGHDSADCPIDELLAIERRSNGVSDHAHSLLTALGRVHGSANALKLIERHFDMVRADQRKAN